jgi:hypothetical protein
MFLLTRPVVVSTSLQSLRKQFIAGKNSKLKTFLCIYFKGRTEAWKAHVLG